MPADYELIEGCESHDSPAGSDSVVRMAFIASLLLALGFLGACESDKQSPCGDGEIQTGRFCGLDPDMRVPLDYLAEGKDGYMPVEAIASDEGLVYVASVNYGTDIGGGYAHISEIDYSTSSPQVTRLYSKLHYDSIEGCDLKARSGVLAWGCLFEIAFYDIHDRSTLSPDPFAYYTGGGVDFYLGDYALMADSAIVLSFNEEDRIITANQFAFTQRQGPRLVARKPFECLSLGMTESKGQVLIACGGENETGTEGKVYQYEPEQGRWTSEKVDGIPRYVPNMVVSHDRAYLDSYESAVFKIPSGSSSGPGEWRLLFNYEGGNPTVAAMEDSEQRHLMVQRASYELRIFNTDGEGLIPVDVYVSEEPIITAELMGDRVLVSTPSGGLDALIIE